ncbi:YpoC family protein [Rossellomorea aquimaris]|uniref:YpoC family protein n=1 Tax=Rossellomorea aquimaris TaxID=189382 RepID=UPI0007D063FC|nr:hypothetical protein [Rossellomorea aquimaris]
MSGISIEVPEEIFDAYFFAEKKVTLRSSPERDFQWEYPYFDYEIQYYNGESLPYAPWNDIEHAVSAILCMWREVEGELATLLKERSSKVEIVMKKGIALYYMLLFWSNAKPVKLHNWIGELENLPIKPVNVKDRLLFVRENIRLYHSYIQLSQLFGEHHKQFAKCISLEKSLRKNSF